MSDVRFGIALDVEGTAEAEGAASALDNLAQQLQSDTRELRAMQSALRNLKGSTNVSADTIDKLRTRVDSHKIVIAEAQAKYVELGGAFTALGSKATAAGSAAAAAGGQQLDAANAAARLGQNTLAANEQVLRSSQLALDSRTSFADLEKQLIQDSQAVKGLSDTFNALGPRTAANAATFDKLKAKLDAQNKALGFAKAKYVESGGTAATLADAMKKPGGEALSLRDRMKGLVQEMSGAPGPVGKLGSGLSALTAVSVGAIAVTAALTAAVVALGAAFVAAAAKAAQFGIKMGLLAREQENLIKQTAATANMKWTWWQRGRASAEGLASAVDEVAESTGATRGEVIKWGGDLQKLGLRGQNLKDAMGAVAIAGVAAGEEGVQSAKNWLFSWRMFTDGVSGSVAKIKREYGELAEEKRLDPSRQFAKLEDNLQRIFKLDVTPLLRGMQKVFALFDDGTAVSDGLRALFTGMFQPLIDSSEKATPSIVRMVKQLLIWGLKLRGGWLDIRLAMVKHIGTIREKFETLKPALQGLWELSKIVGLGLLVSLGLAFVALAITMAPVVLGVLAIGYAFKYVSKGIQWLGEKLGDLVFEIANFDYGAFAQKLIDGLVNGIKKGYAKVKSAVKGLVSSVFGTADQEAEVKSPSRRAARTGAFIGQGYSVGLENMQPKVEASAAKLADISVSAKPSKLPAQPTPQPKAFGAKLDVADLLPSAVKPYVTPAPQQAAPRPALPAPAPRPFSVVPPQPQISVNAPAAPGANPSSERRQPTTVPPAAPFVPRTPPAATPAQQPAQGKAGATITVGDVHISIGSVPEGTSAKDLGEQVWEDFINRLEAAGAGMGAA